MPLLYELVKTSDKSGAFCALVITWPKTKGQYPHF